MTATGGRRIVSVLVVDVAGSTGIAERLGPERSKFLFDEVVTLMREEVARFGGTVAQLTGDGVLALFGAPSAHEDDPERAVRAGLALADAISRYGEEIGTAYGVELGVRAAVNTGPVVVPEGEAPPAELYNALGDTVNVAARLQALGDLVVGPETARQLEGSFELEALGDVDLKGKAESVAAFRVLKEVEAPAISPSTPLVGREKELALLEGALEELSDSRSAIIVLTGEPGVGKSRLKSEARDRFVCETRGPNWYEERPLVGNGPFVLEEADERRARLIASPTWHGARGNILEIEGDYVASDEEVTARWRRGRYDFILFLRVRERDENTVIDSSAGMSTTYLAFRTDRPPLDDVHVRRALAHAIDRRRYAQHSGRPGDPAGAGGFVPPTVPGHSHRVAPEYDPEAARDLLAEAGYPNGNGLRELAIGQVEDWFLAGDIADQLADVGVRARVIRAPFEAFDDLIRGDADMFVWGWNADFPDPEGMISLFLEAHPFVLRDAAVETLLKRARSLDDQDRRLAAYREIEQLWIGEHVALVPLQYDRRTSVLRPWIERFWQNALVTSTLADAVVSR